MEPQGPCDFQWALSGGALSDLDDQLVRGALNWSIGPSVCPSVSLWDLQWFRMVLSRYEGPSTILHSTSHRRCVGLSVSLDGLHWSVVGPPVRLDNLQSVCETLK